MNLPRRSFWRAQADPDQPSPFWGERVVEVFLGMPRIVRVLLSGLLALATTLSIFPVVDQFYVAVMFNPSTVILPSLFSAMVGAGVYTLGWRLIVGTVDDTPPARPAVLIYLLSGAFILLVDVVLIVHGLSMVEFASSGGM